jgi:hypothetical protein
MEISRPPDSLITEKHSSEKELAGYMDKPIFFRCFHVSYLCVIFLQLITVFFVPAGSAGAAEIQGQRPLMVIGDFFRFIPGSWATYTIKDRVGDETFRVYVATLEKVKQNEKLFSWMEVEVMPEKAPTVITRFLVEETKDGPGELLDVTVQVKGLPPFKVPRRFYEGKEKEVGDFQNSYVAKRIARRSIVLNGKSIDLWDVRATDRKERKIVASVSEEVPPLGIVRAESEKTSMVLDKWGMDAKSKIEGKPIDFYLWLIMQIGRGLVK